LPRLPWGGPFHVPFFAPFYHVVSDEYVPHVTHLLRFRTVQEFQEDLEFFLSCYKPLSLSDLLLHAKNETAPPPNAFFLSFDDGLRESYDIIAPLLRKKGVPATFFVNVAALDNAELLYRHKASLLADRVRGSEYEGRLSPLVKVLASGGVRAANCSSALLSIPYSRRELLDEAADQLSVDFKEYLLQRQPYLNRNQVRSLMSQGFTVGAHSLDHPYYPELAIEEQIRQTRESLQAIAQVFELDYKVFAFPFGDDGVSGEFFSKIEAEGAADLLFGSSGFLKDEYHPLVIQRVSMEDQPYHAEDILRMAEMKFALKLFCGKAVRRRSK